MVREWLHEAKSIQCIKMVSTVIILMFWFTSTLASELYIKMKTYPTSTYTKLKEQNKSGNNLGFVAFSTLVLHFVWPLLP